ncbi:MAG: Flp family type IVb pilin [Planctomycetales bacterium]
MLQLVNKFWTDEEGATMVEYGLMLALICVLCIPACTFLGVNIMAAFLSIVAALGGS